MQLEHVPRKRTQDQEEGQGQTKLNRGVEQVLQELVGENGNVEEFANNLRVLLEEVEEQPEYRDAMLAVIGEAVRLGLVPEDVELVAIERVIQPVSELVSKLVNDFARLRDSTDDVEKLKSIHAQYAMSVAPFTEMDIFFRKLEQAFKLKFQDNTEMIRSVLAFVDNLRATHLQLVTEPALQPIYSWTYGFKYLSGASAQLMSIVILHRGGPWVFRHPSAYVRYVGMMPKEKYSGYLCTKGDSRVYASTEEERGKLEDEGYSCKPRRWCVPCKASLWQQVQLFMKNDTYISNIAANLRQRIKGKHPDFPDARVYMYLVKDLGNLMANWVYVMSLSMMKRRIKGKEVEWVGVRIEPYIEMLKRLYENKTASYKPGFPIDPEELTKLHIWHFGIPSRKTYVNPVTKEVVFS